MANLKLKNPSGGSLNLVSADGASDLTVTFPATTGTAMVSGNMPAFGAYASSAQAMSAGTYAKILFDTEEFDTNNNFSSSRFTPTVAGYYQINARFRVSSSVASVGLILYKNGSIFKDGISSDTNAVAMGVNCLVYANGTTDYFEAYGYFSNSQNTTAGQQATWFNGFLVRTA
jgi:hypothetical protein